MTADTAFYTEHHLQRLGATTKIVPFVTPHTVDFYLLVYHPALHCQTDTSSTCIWTNIQAGMLISDIKDAIEIRCQR